MVIHRRQQLLELYAKFSEFPPHQKIFGMLPFITWNLALDSSVTESCSHQIRQDLGFILSSRVTHRTLCEILNFPYFKKSKFFGRLLMRHMWPSLSISIHHSLRSCHSTSTHVHVCRSYIQSRSLAVTCISVVSVRRRLPLGILGGS